MGELDWRDRDALAGENDGAVRTSSTFYRQMRQIREVERQVMLTARQRSVAARSLRR
jgi:hypothetical protein